ncbi:trigger factor, partial [Candidatus Saccharibacteria bacterium]|nr:trigger factor [Candidatus Saccharibacteria bacterium]
MQLKALQKGMAQHEKVTEDRPAREGDFVLVDLEGLHAGEPVPEFAKTENFSMQIGKAVVSEEFDKQLT